MIENGTKKPAFKPPASSGETVSLAQYIRATVGSRPEGRVHEIFSDVRVRGHVDKVLAALDEARAAGAP
jgi:peroxiredoxin